MVALLKMPPTLKLHRDDDAQMPRPSHADAPTGAERRMFPRKEIHVRVEGKRVDHAIPARQQPHLSLALRDLSFGGLSAVSQTPLEAGERLAVFFPPEGARRGWDAYGRVLRCHASAAGYRVAVEFDPLPAAA
ncbi:MAG: PilZ domain-containing protein [Tepidisphaeraceae bacterium]